MVDFLRLVQQPLIGTVIFIMVIWVIAAILLRQLDEDTVPVIKKTRNIFVFIVLLAFVIFALRVASVNSVPRGRLDEGQGVVSDRARELDKRVHQPDPPVETQKKEGGGK